MALVCSFHNSKCEPWVYGVLNNVRNLIAHNLSFTEIEIEITVYTALWKSSDNICLQNYLR